ncbi:UNVERIFIED_CONTAM: hypothetical protein K2H54_055964 [Gekko kuhli]
MENITPDPPGVENVDPAPLDTESINIGLRTIITPDQGFLTRPVESRDRILRHRTDIERFCKGGRRVFASNTGVPM